MDASALLKDVERTLDDICAKTIFTGMLPASEYRYRYLVNLIQAKIREIDVSAKVSLNHQLRNLQTDVENLVAVYKNNLPGSSTTSFLQFIYFMKPTNFTQKMKKVTEQLDRVVYEAEYLIVENEKNKTEYLSGEKKTRETEYLSGKKEKNEREYLSGEKKKNETEHLSEEKEKNEIECLSGEKEKNETKYGTEHLRGEMEKNEIECLSGEKEELVDKSEITLGKVGRKKEMEMEEIIIHGRAHEAEYLKRLKEIMGEFGREKETEEIIDQLLMYLSRSTSLVTPVPVITITGLAGIGKTILARLVCEHSKVKHKVGKPVWVPYFINYTFDSDFIAEFVIDRYHDTPQTKNPNIFVILDDLTAEMGDGDLEALQHRLNEAGLHVAAIIITTRSSRMVGKIAASPVNLYVLQGLDEEESMCLFDKIVGLIAGDNKYPLVSSIAEDVRRKIAGQCRGVPLAIVVMAKLLYSRPSPSQLTQFMTQDFPHHLWNFYNNELAIQEFPHKLCLAYFSVFPQDYLIDAERLIHLWMAEGFVDSSNPSRSYESDREAIGRGYLRDLVDRSIFQDIKEDELGVVRSCRMHPLMHDIARFLADTNERTSLRASFDLSMDFSRGIHETLFAKAKELTSMFFFARTAGSRLPLQLQVEVEISNAFFKRFKRLCVLDLRGLGIKKVPRSIGKLSDLVYLDLSQNNMKKLPSSITKLSKLETLKLARCYSLEELPNKFEKLTKLEHLDLEGCMGLTRMPRNMSKLSSLRTLTAFVACKNDPTGFEQLASLTEMISGHLEILHMERVQIIRGGRLISSEQESYLQRLTLRWDIGVYHRRILILLPPHLRVLIIVGYRYYWPFHCLTSFEFLVKLSLCDCLGCEILFESCQLPKLKILELLRLDDLEFIADDYETNEPSWSNMEELIISDCPKLKSWGRDQIVENKRPFFAKISKLHVHRCPLLTSMPLYPHLDQELVLVASRSQLLFDSIAYATDEHGFSKLRSMVVSSVTGSYWPENFSPLACFNHMSSLQRLTIENCAEMNLDCKRIQWEGLKSLRFLTVKTIPILSTLSFGDTVTTLRELTLHNCNGLTSISDTIGKVTSLRRLSISRCNKLESLPKTMKDLMSLKTLIILDCALLLPRCQPETGDDWPQIRHVKHIQVK